MMMKATHLPKLLLGGLMLAILPAHAGDGFIWINVSIKCIVDPNTGATPSNMHDDVLRATFTDMNRWLANNYRGYRLRMVDMNANNTFKRIGALNDTFGPSYWYNINLKPDDPPSADLNNKNFEIAAKADKTAYGWNDNAINLYFNNSGWSRANFPSSGRAVVISGYGIFDYVDTANPAETVAPSYKVAGNLLHEFGHFFELYHTHQEDGMADTAPDVPSPTDPTARDETYTRNQISQNAYGVNYSALSAANKVLVDNSANNAMSYHQLFYDNFATGKVVPDAERFGPTRFLFTELQMDRWGDYANDERFSVTSGHTIFVDRNDGGLSHDGSLADPYKALLDATISANPNGNDIILMRSGNYTTGSSGIITKPVTLRATRQGPVTITKP